MISTQEIPRREPGMWKRSPHITAVQMRALGFRGVKPLAHGHWCSDQKSHPLPTSNSGLLISHLIPLVVGNLLKNKEWSLSI